MKILITGGCGFIGSSLAIFLKEKIKTAQITSIDNLSRKGSTLNKNRITENKIPRQGSLMGKGKKGKK